jgi:hypothetical protein
MMYERLLDKNKKPMMAEIYEVLGKDGVELIFLGRKNELQNTFV